MASRSAENKLCAKAQPNGAYVQAADLIDGIGDELRRVRKRRGLAQGDAAVDMGVSEFQLCRWERGAKPSFDSLVTILRWCGDENARSFR